MTRLESTTDAEAHPGLRQRLAEEYRLSLAEVALAIDEFCRGRDGGFKDSLELFLKHKMGASCVGA